MWREIAISGLWRAKKNVEFFSHPDQKIKKIKWLAKKQKKQLTSIPEFNLFIASQIMNEIRNGLLDGEFYSGKKSHAFADKIVIVGKSHQFCIKFKYDINFLFIPEATLLTKQ